MGDFLRLRGATGVRMIAETPAADPTAGHGGDASATADAAPVEFAPDR